MAYRDRPRRPEAALHGFDEHLAPARPEALCLPMHARPAICVWFCSVTKSARSQAGANLFSSTGFNGKTDGKAPQVFIEVQVDAGFQASKMMEWATEETHRVCEPVYASTSFVSRLE